MLKFLKGDMFDSGCNVIVNTVNTLGVSGGGVALAFKEKFPKNYEAYAKHCKTGKFRPGEIFWCAEHWEDDGVIIANAATKGDFRNPSEYIWQRMILLELRQTQEIVQEMLNVDEMSVRLGIPALGCGLGGLDWEVLKPHYQKILGDIEEFEILAFEPW